MALVSKNIPNLINGVSQQPPALRLESQGEVQENGFSDVVDGLKKRPPTQFLKKLVKTSATWSDGEDITASSKTTLLTVTELSTAFFHSYKRSEEEQYTVVVINTSSTIPTVLVYDIAGNLRYESGEGSWEANGTHIADNNDLTAYIGSNSDLTATSVADATFLVNKKKTVALSDTIANPRTGYDALVYLKSVNYGREYTCKIIPKAVGSTAGVTATYETVKQITSNANSADTINSDGLKVSTVINDLRGDIYAGVSATASFPPMGTLDTSTSPTNTPTIDYQTLTVTDSSVLPTGSATSYTDLQIVLGGQVIPYDATGVNGWKFGNAHNKVVLPSSSVQIVSQSSYGSIVFYWKYRASVAVNLLSASTGVRNVEPTTYSKEPYFIISSTDEDGMGDFDIVVTDDDGGVNLKAFKETAKSFTDLPNQCLDGFRLGVVGDNQKKEDDFHVVFTGGAGSGYWKETTGHNQKDFYSLATMPHTLRQNADLSFTFGEGEWNERKAGDDNTNPAPSFVGNTISDIFFHRNRLGVLADENIIFSEASNYFNFWRTTVRTLLDSDPIDVAVSQNEVSELKAAVPIQDNLLLFSELNQFTLSSSQLLTPAEITIDQSTKYECDLRASPVGAGTSVFFATKSGLYSGMREFFTKEDSEIKDASDITSHVPQYLQGYVRKMAASSNEDTLLCLTSTNKKECYVYKWYNSSEERLQSSWSKWVFKEDILDVHFNNAELYFTFADGSFEKMDLTSDYNTTLLDSWIVMGQYTPNGDNLPTGYSAGASDTKIAVTDDGLSLGAYDDANRTTAQQAEYDASKPLYIGEPYTFKYGMSEQVFKPAQGDPTNLARFQLRKMSFNYNNSGHFDVEVDSVGRSAITSHFTGRVLGDQHNLLDEAAIISDGSFQVGVQAQANKTNITITNDSHLPCIFQSAEWEGFIVLRNKRI
jgi:hypothetical protein